MSAFDYTESENTVALAQIAATMKGSISERFSRIAALMDAAEATSTKVMDGHTVIKIVRVATAINKQKATSESLVREAIELLQTAGKFGSERVMKKLGRDQISFGSIVPFQLPSVDKSPVKIPAEIVNAVESYDFTPVTTFDKWLAMMMPGRKKIDRLPRFRLYLSGPDGNLEDVDRMLQDLKLRFKNGFPDGHFWWNGKAATADFMTWDAAKTREDLSNRGKKGAKKLWGENSD